MSKSPMDSPASHTPWFVVNTHPHREHIAVENLERQGFTTYCPSIRRRISHARRVKDVLRPLFPNYMFVQVDQDQQRWRPILSTVGVRALVRFGDRLGRLDPGFVETLRAREIDGAIVRPPTPYEVGQVVRLSTGAFDGLVATIIDMDEKDRLIVLMDLLNQSVKVKVSAAAVTPIGRSAGGQNSMHRV